MHLPVLLYSGDSSPEEETLQEPHTGGEDPSGAHGGQGEEEQATRRR